MSLKFVLNDPLLDEIEMRCNNLYNNLIQYFVARLKGLREVSVSPLTKPLC